VGQLAKLCDHTLRHQASTCVVKSDVIYEF
jgi:hypothetical protein